MARATAKQKAKAAEAFDHVVRAFEQFANANGKPVNIGTMHELVEFRDAFIEWAAPSPIIVTGIQFLTRLQDRLSA